MVKTFLLSLAPTCNGVYRTCLLTPSATDTFRTVGVFHRVDHHLASLCTFSTVNAFFHIYTVAVNGDLIEYGIKCAKRTNITAKWSVNNNGKNNCHDQNCIFPYVRGREKSREPKEIIREIERLVSDGVKEVMLLGQNVNSYGKTLDDNVTFAELLREIAKIDGLERIRFMTPHPKDLSDELIEAIRDNSKICNHIHLPLQSGSSRLLKLMNRQYTKEHYLELVDKIRNTIPDISITTDIIVGFPGETEEDFEDTLDVVRKAKYDSAYTFIYSKRTGTPAAKMDGQVSEDIVKDRFNRLLATVSEVSHEHIKRYEGMDMDVLVEDIDDHDNTFVTGRMTNNILVHFKGDKELIGSIVNVHLDECKGFYYMGELCK